MKKQFFNLFSTISQYGQKYPWLAAAAITTSSVTAYSYIYKQPKHLRVMTVGQHSVICTNLAVQYLTHAGVIKGPSDGVVDATFLEAFWMDQVDMYRKKGDPNRTGIWGHRMHELPQPMSSMSDALPDMLSDDQLRFNQLIPLRQHAIQKLKDMPNHEVVQSKIKMISTTQSYFDYAMSYVPFFNTAFNYDVKLKVETEDGRVYTYAFDSETRVINTTSMPRKNKVITSQGNGKDLPPQTELAKIPLNKLPKRLITFGIGSINIWGEDKVKGSRVLFILRNPQKYLEAGNRGQAVNNGNTIIDDTNEVECGSDIDIFKTKNLLETQFSDDDVDKLALQELFKKYLDEQEISIDELPDNHLMILRKDSLEIIYDGVAYNSMGYVPKTIPTEDLPTGMYLDVNTKTTRQQEKYTLFSSMNVGPGTGGERTPVQILEIFGKYIRPEMRVFTVEVESLVVLQDDIPYLSQWFGTTIPVMQDITRQITELKVAPKNWQQFLKSAYECSEQRDESDPSCDYFNDKVDELFEKRREIFSPLAITI